MMLRYRLSLDLGSASLGWAMVRLDADGRPCAIVRAGVRIFSDGRNPKDGASLAVGRRNARSMRRRRDRLLQRKRRMMALLIKHGLFPRDVTERRALESLDPYELRAKGLDFELAPNEMARALFHLNQRRGFKSNRKTDRKDEDSGALKTAISALRQQIDPAGDNGKARTVGELLWKRAQVGEGVRARYRERPIEREDGKTRIDKSYDLYVDRSMIEAEFDALWSRQAAFNSAAYTALAGAEIRQCLLFQRPLRPVKPGRCTLEPDEERAPLALPSQQRFRIYQEVNNLRILHGDLREEPLTIQQRDQLVGMLERPKKDKKSGHEVTFDQMRAALGLAGSTKFNLEDAKRAALKGNATSSTLSRATLFGRDWDGASAEQQDAIVTHLLTEESEDALVHWLREEFGYDAERAENIANVSLVDGYGGLSTKALARLLPVLKSDVVTFDKAVQLAGYVHHSRLGSYGEVPGVTIDTGVERVDPTTGEIQRLHAHRRLPYYGEYLQRHVAFGTGIPEDPPERRFGKIANPTVHIGLNQVRVVVNALIDRYGHPSEIIVELARELKQSREQRNESQEQQVRNQRRNERLRAVVAEVLQVDPDQVRQGDIQKLILWEELGPDAADRRCPYSGAQISLHMALSDEVEVEHILPFSLTLDDSLNNKTLATRRANRVKGNRTPLQAKPDLEREGWSWEGMLQRAERMPKKKRYRFGPEGLDKWLREDRDFLARALNDTRHLSRVAREYLSLVCPQGTRVIPGQMTALLRGKFGLNEVLGVHGEKNRNDHRHHAVDACVIAVTDQGMLQRFAEASAGARERNLGKLVDTMPVPWTTYREHVKRAISHVRVSHKPDHGHEGPLMEATAYGIRKDGSIRQKERSDGKEVRTIKNLIRINEPGQSQRHGADAEGNCLPYVGYVGGSNYCIEIIRGQNGAWKGEVVTTFAAYRRVANEARRLQSSGLPRKEAEQRSVAELRSPNSSTGKSLVMRLRKSDCVIVEGGAGKRLLRVVKIDPSTNIVFAEINEAGELQKRHAAPDDSFRYTNIRGDSLRLAKARRVTISPVGDLHDAGFKE